MNCHLNGITDFGKEFEVRDWVWDKDFAETDSDGDGFTNGEELQDPEGNWREGDADPGDAAKVTNPGDPTSFPEEATPTPTPTITPTPTPTPPPSGVLKIGIKTDKVPYQEGNTIKVLITLHTGSEDIEADVYLAMTGGQTSLSLGSNDESGAQQQQGIRRLSADRRPLPVLQASADEMKLHDELLEIIDKKSGGSCLWKETLQ